MTSTILETTAADPLVIVSNWRARQGHQQELETLFGDLVGSAGVVLHEAGAAEYHVARRFHDREEMERWQASPERAALHAELAEVAERVGEPERLSGLEPWFAAVGRPPRWKMWLASFIGAYPLVVLFQWLVAAHVEPLPLLVRSAVLPLVLLSLMTYVMMPCVTRLMGRWLVP